VIRQAARLLLGLGAVALAHGLRAAPAPAPLAALAPDLQPGVSVTFTSTATGRTEVRRDRMMALAVPFGNPSSSGLGLGPFRAVLETELKMPLRTEVKFSFEGRGTAELSLNGRVVLTETGDRLGTKPAAAVTLNQGTNRLAVAYTPDPAGDAVFRLIWAGQDFGPEPLPPGMLRTDASAQPLRSAERIRAGRALFGDLQCARCHAVAPLAQWQMPELDVRPPSLAQAGTRFREDWLAAWIADPHALRPDTPMPRVHLETPRDAHDIAAYLSSLGTPATAAPAAPALVNGGGRLFAELRCVACHPVPGTAPAAGDGRVSLAAVPAKWQPAALAAYLQNPQKDFPASRMPDFRLSALEARQLAGFLLSSPAPTLPASSGDKSRGQPLFVANCASCHGPAEGTGPVASATNAPDLNLLLERSWTQGCLAETPAARRNAPDFDFTAAQRDNLRAFAAAGAATRSSPAEVTHRSFDTLRCNACHARDGQPAGYDRFAGEAQALLQRSGATAEADAENASLDQEPPSLTWAGEKLRPAWLSHQLAGDLPVSARPWLKASMPSFKQAAAGLSVGLALEHGLLPSDTPPPAADPDLAALGERLAGPEVFGCTACHAVGSTPALAPFGAPGINFALVPSRLRDDYYRRWLDNPPRIEPRTKMPKFTSEPGRSLQTGILDGHAHAQWDALLAFLRTVAETEGPSLPQK
jgi:cytochrome c2